MTCCWIKCLPLPHSGSDYVSLHRGSEYASSLLPPAPGKQNDGGRFPRLYSLRIRNVVVCGLAPYKQAFCWFVQHPLPSPEDVSDEQLYRIHAPS